MRAGEQTRFGGLGRFSTPVLFSIGLLLGLELVRRPSPTVSSEFDSSISNK